MNSPNLKAFMTMIGSSEGTVTSPLTKDDGYDVIVTGIDEHGIKTPEVFTDYEDHPFAIGSDPAKWREPKVINTKGLASTAAGRYQILRRFWLSYKKSLNLGAFDHEGQDVYCVQQFRERNALALIDAGKFDDAVYRLSGLWASMPGKPYPGQTQHPIERLRAFYLAAGGKFSA